MGLCVELGQVPSQDGHNLSEERCLERPLRTVSASQLRPRPSPPRSAGRNWPRGGHIDPALFLRNRTPPLRLLPASPGACCPGGERRLPGQAPTTWKRPGLGLEVPPIENKDVYDPPHPWELPHPQRPRARPEPRTHLCQQSPREAGAVCALIMASLHGPGGFQQSRPSR